MAFFDITETTNQDLGIALPSQTTASYPTPQIKWDITLGGLDFLLAMNDQFPMLRETATFRRDRIDTERNPGEQSLDSGYWLRSGSTFHYGSGSTSAEPLGVDDNVSQFRYHRGGGVDPWTKGQMSLLKDTEVEFADGVATATDHQVIGVDTGVLYRTGSSLYYKVAGVAETAVSHGGTGALKDMATDGANYYVATATEIMSGALPSGAGSKIWDAANSNILIRWVKSRLMAAIDEGIYELVGSGPTLPTALFTHPTSGWVWDDMAEGPTAIYVAGHSGDTSVIYKITVSTTTTTVDLDQPATVAELPRGEIVRSLYSYVGTYLVVGTNKGVRIAQMGTDGSLQMGPLLVETEDGVYDSVAVGSYVYVTVGTKGEAGDRQSRGGLYRIDLGQSLGQELLRFAAAPDLVCPAASNGEVRYVTVANGKLWFTAEFQGLLIESDEYVSEGWFETGRIRMGTIEAKAWRSLRLLQREGSVGQVSAYASLSDQANPSTWSNVLTLATGTYDDQGSMNRVAPIPSANLYLAFRLIRNDSFPTQSPEMLAYQLRSVPAPKRAELIQIPLMCFDQETDRTGVRYGFPGASWARFQTIKALESSASTIQYTDHTTGEAAEVFIEKVTFTRTTPPTRHNAAAGGVMQVTLRLV